MVMQEFRSSLHPLLPAETPESAMLQDPYSLLPIAYRAACQVVESPVLAAEASERAVHQLTLAVLDGCPPQSPKAWLRVVARRSACALLRSEWARTRSMDLADVAGPPGGGGDERHQTWVREEIGRASCRERV